MKTGSSSLDYIKFRRMSIFGPTDLNGTCAKYWYPWINFQAWLFPISDWFRNVDEKYNRICQPWMNSNVVMKYNKLANVHVLLTGFCYHRSDPQFSSYFVPVMSHARKLLLILDCGCLIGCTPLKSSFLASLICLI